mmetsp:Transcript_41650/g.98831  ORF Transcript_41650/g.98831 Transcript_41650/m.98831 type:complete len:273 (+) Transcript_41650:341-1159(+)
MPSLPPGTPILWEHLGHSTTRRSPAAASAGLSAAEAGPYGAHACAHEGHFAVPARPAGTRSFCAHCGHETTSFPSAPATGGALLPDEDGFFPPDGPDGPRSRSRSRSSRFCCAVCISATFPARSRSLVADRCSAPAFSLAAAAVSPPADFPFRSHSPARPSAAAASARSFSARSPSWDTTYAQSSTSARSSSSSSSSVRSLSSVPPFMSSRPSMVSRKSPKLFISDSRFPPPPPPPDLLRRLLASENRSSKIDSNESLMSFGVSSLVRNWLQ